MNINEMKNCGKLFDFNVITNTGDGRCAENKIKLYEETYGNVTAVFASGMSENSGDYGEDGSFDPDNGIVIKMNAKMPYESYVSIYKYGEFWNEPNFGSDFAEVPDETQLLIVKMSDKRYTVLLPVCGDDFKCVFVGGDKSNELRARVFCWKKGVYSCNDLAFVCAEGENPFKLVKECVSSALEAMQSPVNTVENRRYPEVFEYLGWCSWDAMAIRVSEDGIMEKCSELKEKSVPIKWAIIDDMWAYIKDFDGREYSGNGEMFDLMHRSALYDYKADPKKFPNGLRGCISKMKKYGLKVGVWYPATGYWRGIAKYGPAYEKLKDCLTELPNGYIVPDWKKSNSYMHYSTVFEYLKKCGVDFIKVDNQSMTRRYYYGLETVGKVAGGYHGGLEAAVGEFFDGCMINCMGASSEDMWHRTLSPVTRVSDDFKPENRAWFFRHVMQCAYTSILQGQFYYCDFDMWWTDDGQNEKNSLIRAVSGGPVYVSDKIGRTRADILKPLAFSDGKILRCDNVCMPTEDCLTVNSLNSGKALKLQNTANGCGIMAVLNVDENDGAVEAEISGKAVNGFNSEDYLAYEYFSREAKALKGNESFKIRLENNNDYRLYIFIPIKDGYAPIGRIDKFITPKSIEYVCGKNMKLVEDGPYAYYEGGKLSIVE